jgi:hypothetical protein
MHRLRAEQLTRVGRYPPCGNDGQIRQRADGLDDVIDLGPADDEVGQPDAPRKAERPRHHRLAQIAVDKHNRHAGLGHGGGQVRSHGRLAVFGQGAGDDEHPRRVVDVDVLQVRAQLQERLPSATLAR